MSLFASLTTAISGLNAQQEAIGNISDNISNANTVGFKGIDTSFQNFVTDSTARLNEPGGVIATPIYQNDVAGNFASSQTPTSLAIVGSGFFQVKAPPSTTGGATVFPQGELYTQAGDFTQNKQGFLVNSAGYYLTGYPVNPQTGIANTSTTSPIQISQLVDAPQATANLNLNANLPADYPISSAAGYTPPPPVTENIVDASGVSHQVSIQFNHTAANTWTADITAAGATPTAPTEVTLTFSDGTTAAGTPPVVSPAGTLVNMVDTTAAATPAGGTPATPSTPAAGTPANFKIPLNFGSGSQTVSFNLGTYGQVSDVTGFSAGTGTPAITATAGDDGVPRGSFQSLSIDQNGFVDIHYTNGDTKPFYQIPVVQFNAPDQLQRMQGGAFGATIDSGPANLNPPGQNGGGTIQANELESSNVDIATQFTKLITAQQVYSANSKVITTANQLLTTIIQIIQ
ncbi:MAG TPA: flagellar hook-basal body complex protein [Aliidongia sp.]|nr:flagellar hook-basal body complex protein [Aliidongia sp.]